MNDGIGIGPDGIRPPSTRLWRWTPEGFGPEARIQGRVAGCGPGWVLLAHAARSVTHKGLAWRFERLGEGPGAVPSPTAALPSDVCASRLDAVDVAALPSGHVMTAGTLCGTHEPAVEIWAPGRAQGRIRRTRALAPLHPRELYLPECDSDGCRLISTSPIEPGDVLFAGDAFRLPADLSARAEIVARVTGFATEATTLYRRGPDGRARAEALPPIARPEAQRAWVSPAGMTAGGDIWLRRGLNTIDCGGCFRYRALVRVPATE